MRISNVSRVAFTSSFVLASALMIVACDGSAVDFPEDGTGASGAGASGAGSGSGASDGGGGNGSVGPGGSGGGPSCDMEPEGDMVCVRGEMSANGEESLRAGGPVVFEIYPEGCYSSSCTETIFASCGVTAEAVGEIELNAQFCLDDTQAQAGVGCTDDCGGAEPASCGMDAIAKGRWTVSLGVIEVAFDVPSMLPSGGSCVGRLD